jgi:hypothetical protein
VRRWAAGERGAPQGIAILLQLLLAGRVTVADVQAAADAAFAD